MNCSNFQTKIKTLLYPIFGAVITIALIVFLPKYFSSSRKVEVKDNMDKSGIGISAYTLKTIKNENDVLTALNNNEKFMTFIHENNFSFFLGNIKKNSTVESLLPEESLYNLTIDDSRGLVYRIYLDKESHIPQLVYDQKGIYFPLEIKPNSELLKISRENDENLGLENVCAYVFDEKDSSNYGENLTPEKRYEHDINDKYQTNVDCYKQVKPEEQKTKTVSLALKTYTGEFIPITTTASGLEGDLSKLSNIYLQNVPRILENYVPNLTCTPASHYTGDEEAPTPELAECYFGTDKYFRDWLLVYRGC